MTAQDAKIASQIAREREDIAWTIRETSYPDPSENIDRAYSDIMSKVKEAAAKGLEEAECELKFFTGNSNVIERLEANGFKTYVEQLWRLGRKSDGNLLVSW